MIQQTERRKKRGEGKKGPYLIDLANLNSTLRSLCYISQREGKEIRREEERKGTG